jgi:hypothetical protein
MQNGQPSPSSSTRYWQWRAAVLEGQIADGPGGLRLGRGGK